MFRVEVLVGEGCWFGRSHQRWHFQSAWLAEMLQFASVLLVEDLGPGPGCSDSVQDKQAEMLVSDTSSRVDR